MRKLRKLVVWILVIALCMPIYALALDGISDDCNVDEVIAVLVHDGIHHELNAKQVNELELCGLESFVEKYDLSVSRLEVSQVTPRNQPGDINTYYETSGSDDLRFDKAVFVTSEFEGPCDLSYGESRTITSTFSGSFSIAIRRKIASDLGGGYSYSVSTNSQFGSVFPVAEYTWARVQFVPRMRHTVGVYCYDSFTSYNVDAYIPLKIFGFADGLYRKVITAYG